MAAASKLHRSEIAAKDREILEANILLKKSQEETEAAFRMLQDLKEAMRN